jgi:hypothetical protein
MANQRVPRLRNMLVSFSKPPNPSIHTKLGLIGTADDDDFDDGPMAERAGVVLLDEEVQLLEDLLEKMFRYRPEE